MTIFRWRSVNSKVAAGAVCSVLLVGCFGISSAFAQSSEPPAMTPVSLTNVQAFLAAPESLLQKYPFGGISMATEVRNLVVSDGSTIDALVALAKTAGPSQKSAIGAGLAQAARALVATQPDLAAAIQQKVAESGDQQLTTAFVAGSSTVQTAAISPGAIGGTPGTGGAINAGPIGGTGSNTGTAGNGQGTSSTSNGNGGFSVSAGGSGTYSNRDSVSPSR